MDQPSDEFTNPADGDDEWSDARDGEAGVRSRWSWLLWVGAFVVLAAATAGVLHAQASSQRTPEAAVLEYVRLIEAGDIEAASELVPVLGSVGTIGAITIVRGTPPELLTNASYEDNPGIRDVAVEPADAGSTAEVGEVVEVVVRYSVHNLPASTLVRAERLPDDFPALPAWKVIDSMATPSLVVAGPYGLGQVLIDGVAVSPLPEYPAPQQVQVETLLYPGVYAATFEGGPYLTAPGDQIGVLTGERLSGAGTSVTGYQLVVEPTPMVNDLIRTKAADHLLACADAPATVNLQTCPRFYREQPGDTRVTDTLMGEHFLTEFDYTTGPVVTGTVRGSLVVTTPDGARNDHFTIVVTVSFDGDEPAASVTASAT